MGRAQPLATTRESALVDHTEENAAETAQTTPSGLTVPGPATTGSGMRASDAERAAAADRLHAALVEGRLGVGETEERLAAVYAARHRSELPPLLADLPMPRTAPPVGGWSPVWRATVDQAWLSSARVRGATPERPDVAQRRAVTVVLAAAALWVIVCLLAGFAAGLVG
jgi:hypothetical protein